MEFVKGRHIFVILSLSYYFLFPVKPMVFHRVVIKYEVTKLTTVI